MSRTEKLLQRLLSIPKDLTWEELVKILAQLGYIELKKGKTGGSRRKFADAKNNITILHKPHPGNIVKEYAIKQVITHLNEKDISKMNDILEYKGYYASLHFSSEDDVFYGKLLGIDDLVNFEGASVTELRKAFYEAVNDYLATCKELGKEPNKTYKGTFNVRIPADLHKSAAVYAALHNVSLNDFVKTAIHYALLHKEDVKKIQSGLQ